MHIKFTGSIKKSNTFKKYIQKWLDQASNLVQRTSWCTCITIAKRSTHCDLHVYPCQYQLLFIIYFIHVYQVKQYIYSPVLMRLLHISHIISNTTAWCGPSSYELRDTLMVVLTSLWVWKTILAFWGIPGALERGVEVPPKLMATRYPGNLLASLVYTNRSPSRKGTLITPDRNGSISLSFWSFWFNLRMESKSSLAFSLC